MNENKLDGLVILKTAKLAGGKFLIEQLDEDLIKIVKAIRKSPQKGGSLNINIALTPNSSDAEMITTIVKIANLKVPVIDAVPILSFSSKEGALHSKHPSQVEMFGDSKEVDKSTGEIKDISSKTNISIIGKNND